jgi:glycosyltransferase involved in cell wall biosynthesis
VSGAVRIDVLTSLYPSPERPHEGIFAERRWRLMARRGHAVRVVAPQPRALGGLGPRAWREIAAAPRREERGGIAVERPRYLHLPRAPALAPGNARRFAAAGLAAILAHEPAPDIVMFDYAWPAAAAAEALGARGLPCVVHGRGSDVLEVGADARLAPALARGLRAAGHWCAVSADLVLAMDRLAGRAEGALTPNGVDLELFQPRERAAARRALGLGEGRRLVLVVGHLIPRKDPLLALEVFARLGLPDVDLAFVGRGALAGALRLRIRELGLESRARLVGEVGPDALAGWYAAADALLLTSAREGRPNVVLEALACGRAVLARASGGTAELLEGLPECLVAGSGAAEIAIALGRLLAAPPPPERLRSQAVRFSWDAGLAALERVLERAIAARRAAGGDG